MSDKLDDIGGLFKNNFDGFKVEPTSTVWSGIKLKLWISTFLKFSIGSFNVYYSTILLSAIIGGITIISTSNNDSNNPINPNDSLVPEYNEITELQNDDLSQIKPLTINDIEDENIDSQSDIPLTVEEITEDVSNPVVIEKANYNANTESLEDIEIKKVEQVVVNDEKDNNSISIIEDTQKLQSQEDIVTEEGPESSVYNIDNPGDEIVEVVTNNEIFEVIPESVSETYYDTIIIYDTIPIYDTLKISIDNNVQGNWSLDIGVETMNTLFSYSSEENPSLAEKMDLSSSISVGYGFGAKINYNYKKWEFQTGLSYLQVTESFSYKKSSIDINTTEFWNYFPTGVNQTLDTLNWQFIFDTEDSSFVYVPILQETITTLFDSTLVTLSDTISKEEVYNNINKYSYLEIPFMVGYELFKKDNLSVGARLGCRVGIFLDGSGKIISSDDDFSVIDFDKNTLPFMMTKIDMVIGLPVYYEIRNGLGFVFEPYYRSGLNSVYETDYVLTTSTGGIGLNLGLRFKF